MQQTCLCNLSNCDFSSSSSVFSMPLIFIFTRAEVWISKFILLSVKSPEVKNDLSYPSRHEESDDNPTLTKLIWASQKNMLGSKWNDDTQQKWNLENS